MTGTITPETVGRLLTLVAPGFFAYTAYALRFPQRRQEQFSLLVICVALSLPLVALSNAAASALGIRRDPTTVAYVALLLGLSAAIGYTFAALRGRRWVGPFLGHLGYQQMPESTIWQATLRALPEEAVVDLRLRDGSRLVGCPGQWPVYPDADAEARYLRLYWSQRQTADGDAWSEQLREGSIVPIGEIASLDLHASARTCDAFAPSSHAQPSLTA